MVAVVPAEREFNLDPILFPRSQTNRYCEKRCLALVQPFDKSRKPAIEMKLGFLHFCMAFITQQNAQAGIEEGQFTQAAFKHGEFKFRAREGKCGWLEGDFRAIRMIRRAKRRAGHYRVTMFKAQPILLAAAPDAHFHPFGQRIHHRRTNTMQAA